MGALAKRLFVANLSFQLTEMELREEFERYGTVIYATLMKDRDSGKPRGFGFVEMKTDEEAQRAIEARDGTDWMDRKVHVSIARPKASTGGQRGGGRDSGPRNNRGGGKRKSNLGGDREYDSATPGW